MYWRGQVSDSKDILVDWSESYNIFTVSMGLITVLYLHVFIDQFQEGVLGLSSESDHMRVRHGKRRNVRERERVLFGFKLAFEAMIHSTICSIHIRIV